MRKNLLQITEPLSKIFSVKSSNVLVEWNFGTPYKNFPPKPEKYARTFRDFLQQLVLSDIYNAGSTIYRKPNSKYRFSWKKFTQECGIEHIIYSFDGGAEKLLCRIQKHSDLTPPTFSGKSSPFYVECSFTKNWRSFSPQIPKASFAVKVPWTREKQYWQVFREIFAQNPKKFCSCRKSFTKNVPPATLKEVLTTLAEAFLLKKC